MTNGVDGADDGGATAVEPAEGAEPNDFPEIRPSAALRPLGASGLICVVWVLLVWVLLVWVLEVGARPGVAGLDDAAGEFAVDRSVDLSAGLSDVLPGADAVPGPAVPDGSAVVEGFVVDDGDAAPERAAAPAANARAATSLCTGRVASLSDDEEPDVGRRPGPVGALRLPPLDDDPLVDDPLVDDPPGVPAAGPFTPAALLLPDPLLASLLPSTADLPSDPDVDVSDVVDTLGAESAVS